MKMWECRDLGALKEYLGMNISKYKKGITIDQIKYATKVVERFGVNQQELLYLQDINQWLIWLKQLQKKLPLPKDHWIIVISHIGN